MGCSGLATAQGVDVRGLAESSRLAAAATALALASNTAARHVSKQANKAAAAI